MTDSPASDSPTSQSPAPDGERSTSDSPASESAAPGSPGSAGPPSAAGPDDDVLPAIPGEEPRGRRRLVGLAVVVGGAIAALVVTARVTTSPAEHAARRRPPAATPVTAVPEVQVLEDVRSGQCTFEVPVVELASAGPPAGAAIAVFTRVDLAPGSPVVPGQRIVDVSGRPVLALPLPFALYRDLTPGDTGSDVDALQATLASMGRLGDHTHGTFDRRTRAAIEQLYEDAGAEAARTGPEVDAAVDAARAAVDALTAQAEAGDPTAGQQLGPARAALAEAEGARGVILPRAEILAVPPDQAVLGVEAVVGGTADAGQVIATLGAPHAGARCQFGLGAGAGLQQGQAARLRTPDGTIHPGTLGPVRPVEASVEAPFTPSGASLPAELAGGQGTIEVVVASTATEVVTVPATALRHGPGGEVTVEALVGGRREAVPVQTGLIAGGWVEVRDPRFDAGTVLVLGPADGGPAGSAPTGG